LYKCNIIYKFSTILNYSNLF